MPKRHSANTHSASITNTGDTTNSTPATLESLDLRGSSPFYYPFLWIWRMKIQDNKKDMWHQPHPLPVPPFCQGQVVAHGKPAAIPRKTSCEHGAWSISVKEVLHCIALELRGKHSTYTFIDDTNTYIICCIKHVYMSFTTSSRARRIMEVTTKDLYNQRTCPPLYGPGFSRVGQSLPERWRTPFGSRCMAATGNVFASCQQAYQFSLKISQGLK